MTSDARPTPESLLENFSDGLKANGRGRLKIYVGMAAGVGKSYAMLADAVNAHQRGIDVVVGYLERHGRAETEDLAATLQSIPPKAFHTGGISIREFDIDAALARRPSLLLVDELAHSNVAGSRHEKRWQDIQEVLESGISVHTTVNIQHLESLKDVVAQITGVTVTETVPDLFFANADEIELIDIPPDELIERLKQGKIYSEEKVPKALQNFFRKGNLIALRELVLRQSAQRVDEQMQQYRRRNGVQEIWPARERVMVLVGPTPMARGLVRQARRLASSLNGELVALTVETPAFADLSPEVRILAQEARQFAESLGARCRVSSAHNIVEETIRIAREENISAIVVGKPIRPRWREIFVRQFVDELVRESGGISVHIISSNWLADSSSVLSQMRAFPGSSLSREFSLRHILITMATVLASSLLCAMMFPLFAASNLIMIYLVGVTWIATKYSYREAALASILSVGAFDFLFVEPRFSFAVADSQYSITFLVMLGVSLSVSRLAQRLKHQVSVTSEREVRTASLYALGRALLGVRTTDALRSTVHSHFRDSLHYDVELFASKSELAPKESTSHDARSSAVATWAWDNAVPAGRGTDTLPASDWLFLPIVVRHKVEGLIRINYDPVEDPSREFRELFEASLNQITLAMERLLVDREYQDSRTRSEREEFRNVLLSSISHDLRTPLTIINGASSTLLESPNLKTEESRNLLESIQRQSDRLSRMVRNVLEITKLETKSVPLRYDWQSLEELLEVAIESVKPLLGSRKIVVNIPPSFPLLWVDRALFEQVLVNIFENSMKYADGGSRIWVTASEPSGLIRIVIEDDGGGFQDETLERLFEKFSTRQNVRKKPGGTVAEGVGLGMTICKTIVEAHSGTITASNRDQGGARITIQLPSRETDSTRLLEDQ